ncbi:hypothetical protein TcCL_NonESM08413 [Trypanosoma cruzi]|uniref:Uncharacterized protein n=1 Tax=Trypanosoma cruzi (strain CL Brener) TaxID=353153 RepID=Q4D3K9_TRYCC|nr:hypothetical protein Tc00.1047053510725.80 [Trypanosoma cruzi]EAN87114.1 hypothetical protein Tc00.1047053510725.80 [Trypanosoma cruzi]RNC41994.1 hypothetical protein TcCL_NonESM08413 [Trypanosoma cruzi]|eukprot:XP_808965.1 hypothetical protein [Trypanosoma cruzi strain CL Brener]
MAAMGSRSPVEDNVGLLALDAIDALSREYMACFVVDHVTPHIMRCLMEVVCPEAASEAKDTATEKVRELHVNAQPRQVSYLLRTLFSASGVNVGDVVSRCAEERHRLTVQMARHHSSVISVRSRLLNQVKNFETEGLSAVKDLQESQALLDAFAPRIQTLETELRAVLPDYGRPDEMFSSGMRQIMDATAAIDAKGTVSSKCGYAPSRDFVLQAARQIFAESHASWSREVNGGRRQEQQQVRPSGGRPKEKDAHSGVMTPFKGTAHATTSLSGFSLTSSTHFPLQALECHSGKEFCDVLPPTTVAISAEALSARMADKRPLRVQEEERTAREKEWSPLGKNRLACKDIPTGPSAYTRLAGVRHALELEQQNS